MVGDDAGIDDGDDDAGEPVVVCQAVVAPTGRWRRRGTGLQIPLARARLPIGVRAGDKVRIVRGPSPVGYAGDVSPAHPARRTRRPGRPAAARCTASHAGRGHGVIESHAHRCCRTDCGAACTSAPVVARSLSLRCWIVGDLHRGHAAIAPFDDDLSVAAGLAWRRNTALSAAYDSAGRVAPTQLPAASTAAANPDPRIESLDHSAARSSPVEPAQRRGRIGRGIAGDLLAPRRAVP